MCCMRYRLHFHALRRNQPTSPPTAERHAGQRIGKGRVRTAEFPLSGVQLVGARLARDQAANHGA